MKKLSLNVKLFIILTLVIVVVGMAMVGFLGFNQTTDFSTGYEVSITAKNALEEDVTTIRQTADEYFVQANVGVVGYETERLNDGETLIYKFTLDPTASISALKQAIVSAVPEVENFLEIEASQTKAFNDNQLVGISIAAAVALVVVIVYLAIMEKGAGLLGALASIIGSALIYVSAVAICRVPAIPFVSVFALASAIISAAFSIVIVNRCNEAIKNVANAKTAKMQIASDMTKMGALRIFLTLGALVLAGVVLGAFAPIYFKFMGIHLVLAGLSATLGSMLLTGLVWALVKKDKKVKQVTTDAE